jgi:hypothetical protein
MIRRFACLLVLLATMPALAFDATTEAVIEASKIGKPVPIASVAELMMSSKRWCYAQQEAACAWSEVYLSVYGNAVEFEVSTPWSDTAAVSYVNQGTLRENRFICETNHDWISSIRAYGVEDGREIGGRDLAALKLDVQHWTDFTGVPDCYDYVFRGADEQAQTIVLSQRQYGNGVTDPANDVLVTLHFDQETADGLAR